MLSQDQIDRYRRDGFLHIPGVYSGRELEALRAAADRLVEEASAYGRELDATRGPIVLHDDHGFTELGELDDRKFLYGRGRDGERLFRRAEGMWQRDAIYRIATMNPLLLNAVYQIVERPVVGANDSMVVKMPGAGAAVPWHRDPTGKDLIAEFGDACSDFTCDIYLDASTEENGALYGLPGSHRGGWDDIDPLDFDIPDAVLLEAQPGDVMFHSLGVLHGSPKNTSASIRRTFYVHFRPPDAFGSGFWDRPAEWIAERRKVTAEMHADRTAASYPDAEPLLPGALAI